MQPDCVHTADYHQPSARRVRRAVFIKRGQIGGPVGVLLLVGHLIDKIAKRRCARYGDRLGRAAPHEDRLSSRFHSDPLPGCDARQINTDLRPAQHIRPPAEGFIWSISGQIAAPVATAPTPAVA